MSTYMYTAIDTAGKTIKGRVEAENQQLVISKLHGQGYHITDVRERKKRASGTSRMSGFKKLKLQSLVIFSRQLATMVNAGVGIIKCLDILEAQSKDEVLKPVIGQAMRDVKSGLSLTDAIAKHPNVFNKLYVNMIRAAELGGILAEILDRIAEFQENEMEVRGKIKSAMMYPVIVLVFSVFMVGALFLFVLPKFKEIFVGMGVDMPVYTMILFNASTILSKFWYIPLGLGVGGFIFIKKYGATTKGRYKIDGLKLKIPVVGDLVQKMAISRFARTFGTLVSSGVPMMRALEIVGETSGNSVIAKAVETARESVREGQKISAPLEGTGLFPGMVIHMIDVGEETGRLSEMLIKVSEFYEREVDAAVKGLTSMIEPMLIVFMGVVVGFIAISIMGPIFKLVSSIN